MKHELYCQQRRTFQFNLIAGEAQLSWSEEENALLWLLLKFRGDPNRKSGFDNKRCRYAFPQFRFAKASSTGIMGTTCNAIALSFSSSSKLHSPESTND
jgi:hypothetical protein